MSVQAGMVDVSKFVQTLMALLLVAVTLASSQMACLVRVSAEIVLL